MPDYPAPGGLGAVRQATREAHARLEASIDLDSWDDAAHQWWLGRLLGLHEPIEHTLDRWWAATPASAQAPAPAWTPALRWPPRRRTELLTADLLALGLDPAQIRALPRCPAPPAPAGRPEVLGQFYVLDGSTLGGAVIAARAQAAGVSPAACRSLVHRSETVRCWRETKAGLDALAPAEITRAAAAAADLFDRFERWLGAARPDQLPACA